VTVASTQTVGGRGAIPSLAGYRLYHDAGGDRTYLKENPITGIRTYLTFASDGTIRVKKTQRVDKIIDRNVSAQNDFTGYRGKQFIMTSSVPLVVDKQLKEQSGFDPVTKEYDENRYNALLDSDYSKLKTIPGKLGRRLKEI
jgi:hypothetical protein